MVDFIWNKTKHNVIIECKEVITYFEHEEYKVEFIINLLILLGKFHIHKCRVTKSIPNIISFQCDLKEYLKSLKMINAKKSNNTEKWYWS